MIMVWVLRNHNGRLLAWNEDMVILAKEMAFYEAVTGNQTRINKETFQKEPNVYA